MKQRSLLLKLHNLSSFDMDQSSEHPTFDTIFRDSDRQQQDSIAPTVAKANPIAACSDASQVPLPSPIEIEVGETSCLPDEIGYDWAMEDDENSCTGIHPLQTVTPLAADQTSSLYSFYFEDATMDDDDSYVSLDDDVVLEDVDFCLDSLRENPEAFWTSAPFCQKIKTFVR